MDIIRRINLAMDAEIIVESVQPELEELMRIAASPSRFDGPKQFKQYLTEGTILNVNTLASQIIGVPSGQYLIYSLDSSKAILIPTSAITVQENEFRDQPRPSEVYTKDLIKLWNKIEILTESDPAALPQNQDQLGAPGEPGESGGPSWSQNIGKPRGKKEQIATSDQRSKWPRDKQAKGAAEASGKTQQEIATAASKIAGEQISEPDVSRALAASGTPSSRMPELHRAAAIASAMGSTIEQVFGTKIGKGAH